MKNTMKRIMALALVLAMIIGVVPSVFAVDYVNHFTDVPTNKWYAEYVEYVNDRGWMNGIGNNLFGPDDTLERAMVATVLYRKAGSPAVAAPSTFTDVPAGKWYSNAVAWAQANGVVNGVSATEFAPSQNVLREELVTMIWRGAGSPVVAEDHLKNFPDAGSVRAYAKAAFNWAIANNIIGGSNGKLLPQDNATRAEFAKIMTQYDKLENPCESHKWDDGKVTKEATCTEAGEKTYTCTVCGATKVVAIPALGHVDANKDNICDRCGEKLGDTPTPPTPTTEKVVIYYAAESKVMTTEEYTYTSSSSGKSKVELVGADATLEDGKVKTSATNVAEFEMTTVDGITTFKTADGKYLYVDGTDVKLVDAEGENTKFVLEDAEGGKFIRCATAKVNENAQYIEFYKNYFTVYRMDSTQAGIYTFGLYPLATGGDEPTPPTPSGDKYVAATELKEGDQVILVCDSKNVALSGTYNGFYNNGLEVAPVDGVIENPDSTIVWTVGKEGEFYTFSYDGKKIGMGDSYTSMPLDAVNYKWQVEAAATEGCFYVKNLDRDPEKAYYMQWRDTNSSWSGYHTLDEALMAIRFYVKTADAPHVHTWNDGVVTTEPTCTTEGVKTFTCTVCGETKTEPVDALGHNYVAGVCSRCGDLLSSADSIVIYYTNDVHTYVDKGLSYDNIAALKKETAKTADGVLLLDAGDHIQGTAYGALDEGEQIIALMNAAGYDAATLGNHEFDYGMARALAVVDEAEFPYLSANFKHVDGTKVLDAYKIFEVGGKKIAIIGITTPESITKSTPAYFMDETQTNWLYTIDGDTLYADVQAAIDAAKAENPDYVIALGHLGDDPSSTPWRSVDVIANTTGLDAFIDGHSHSTVEMKEVADKDGKNVVLTQTGSYFDAVGKLVIKDGKITTSLIKSYVGSDEAVKAIKDALIAKVDTQLGEKIGTSEVNLTVNDADGKRAVRSQETNLGDFTADALRYYFNVTEGLHADVAIMNGGGIRANMDAGDLTYKSCKTVHTFGNVACLMEVTGQQILDALEWGAKDVGVGENGGFLQVSGLTYEIHSYIPSTVQQADKIWTGAPTGEYRVKNVKIGGEDLDLNKTYTLAGYNYTIRNMGDGFNMFKDAKLVKDYVQQDYLVLANYVKNFPEATVKADNSPLGANYSNIGGEGRITIVSEKPTEPEEPEKPTFTLATELKDGDQVIIVNAESGKAMSEDAVATKYRAGVDVVPVDNAITTEDSKIVWTVAVVDGGYQFKNDAGETLSATNGLSFADSDNVWALTAGTAANTFIISSTTAKGSSGDPKSIEWFEKYSEFSTFYKNDSNESLFAMNLYVKTAGADPTPHVHTWDDGVVTTEPTCTAEGVKTYTCTGCSETKTEAVAALGHNYVNGTCTRCGAAEPTTPPVTSGSYVKVTEDQKDWSGTYLIVYEASDLEAYVFTGVDTAANYVSAEIVKGAIASDTATKACEVTVAKQGDGYSFQLTGGENSGKYLTAYSGRNKVVFSDTAKALTISVVDGVVKVFDGTAPFQFNKSNNGNGLWFRFFGKQPGGQSEIALYKLAD